MEGLGHGGVAPSSGTRLPGIEGLRAVAACSILVFHTWKYAGPGGRSDVGALDRVLPDLAFGVTLFFTLSGFLLYRPFVAVLIRENRIARVAPYLRNRALRILPAYWVILLLCALVFQSVLLREDGRLTHGAMSDPGLLITNALLLQNYVPGSVITGIGPAWSLAVEVVFYLSLPLLVLLAFGLQKRARSRAARRAAVLAPAFVLLAVGLCGKATAAWVLPAAAPFADWDTNWHSVLARSFLCQADLFAFGMILAVLRVDWEDGRLRLPRGWRTVAALGALTAYLVTAGMTGQAEHLSYSPYNTLMALACALVLALVVLPPGPAATRTPFVRVLESRALVWLGLVSYSVFLWHEPLARWISDRGLGVAGTAGFFVNVLMVALLTFALSAITYRFVEAPALRLKAGKRPARSPQPPRRAATKPVT